MAEGKEVPSRIPPRKISFDQTVRFEREGFSGNIFVNPEDGLGYSALLVDVHGAHPLKQMVGATRSYYVIEGEGVVALDGVVQEVKEGDLFIIPDGGQYQYQGQMKLWEVNVPGTTSANAITPEQPQK